MRILMSLSLVALLGACQTTTMASVDGTPINFGDDTSVWANDAECDDPRFEGPGAADVLLADDLYRDATDCLKLLQAGLVRYRG